VAVLVNNQPFTIQQGASEVGPVNPPNGTQTIQVTYECGAWPVVSDGQLVVTLKISDNNGAVYRDEWTDTFQHQRLMRYGVVQNNASFGIGLQAPFGNQARLRVAFQNSGPAINTTVTVTAV
jgi:hypothetical protein